MAIKLEKKSKLSLAKDVNGNGLNKIRLGLGWDEASTMTVVKNVTKPRLFGLLGHKEEEVVTTVKARGNIDIDSSILVYNDRDTLVSEVSFRKLTLSNSKGEIAIKHKGDNTTGRGAGDDEVINLFLDKMPSNAHKLYIVLNIYNATGRGQNFDMVDKAYVNIYDDEKNTTLASFDLSNSDDYTGKTGVIVGKVIRTNDGFEFVAIGDGVNAGSIEGLKNIACSY